MDMKTLLLTSVLLTSSAFAETVWNESTFWKAPQATSFSLKLKGKEKLASECTHFKGIVFKEDGSLSNAGRDKSRLQRYRKLIEPVVIEIDMKPWAKFEQKVVADEIVDSGSDKLPYFTQKEAVTGLLLPDVSNLKIRGGDNSYSEIYRQAGLEEASVELSQTRSATYALHILDRDVACDLYENKGQLTGSAPAYIHLSESGVNQITEFYNKTLLPEINDVLKLKSEHLTQKAARIGYRTGKILEEEFSSENSVNVEKQMREVLKSVLNPKTLEISSNVIRSGDQLFLNLDGGLEANNVLVVMEF